MDQQPLTLDDLAAAVAQLRERVQSLEYQRDRLTDAVADVPSRMT